MVEEDPITPLAEKNQTGGKGDKFPPGAPKKPSGRHSTRATSKDPITISVNPRIRMEGQRQPPREGASPIIGMSQLHILEVCTIVKTSSTKRGRKLRNMLD